MLRSTRRNETPSPEVWHLCGGLSSARLGRGVGGTMTLRMALSVRIEEEVQSSKIKVRKGFLIFELRTLVFGERLYYTWG